MLIRRLNTCIHVSTKLYSVMTLTEASVYHQCPLIRGKIQTGAQTKGSFDIHYQSVFFITYLTVIKTPGHIYKNSPGLSYWLKVQL